MSRLIERVLPSSIAVARFERPLATSVNRKLFYNLLVDVGYDLFEACARNCFYDFRQLKGDTGGGELTRRVRRPEGSSTSPPPCRPLLFPLLCFLWCVNLASYAYENKT